MRYLVTMMFVGFLLLTTGASAQVDHTAHSLMPQHGESILTIYPSAAAAADESTGGRPVIPTSPDGGGGGWRQIGTDCGVPGATTPCYGTDCRIGTCWCGCWGGRCIWTFLA